MHVRLKYLEGFIIKSNHGRDLDAALINITSVLRTVIRHSMNSIVKEKNRLLWESVKLREICSHFTLKANGGFIKGWCSKWLRGASLSNHDYLKWTNEIHVRWLRDYYRNGGYMVSSWIITRYNLVCLICQSGFKRSGTGEFKRLCLWSQRSEWCWHSSFSGTEKLDKRFSELNL